MRLRTIGLISTHVLGLFAGPLPAEARFAPSTIEDPLIPELLGAIKVNQQAGLTWEEILRKTEQTIQEALCNRALSVIDSVLEFSPYTTCFCRGSIRQQPQGKQDPAAGRD